MSKKPVSLIEISLAGMKQHAEALRVCLAAKLPALLIGETGTGKTTLAQLVAQELGRPCVRVNLDGGSTPDELIGRYQLRGHETFYQHGIIPQAMRSGSVLILDELNAALPDTLFAIHALLESSPRLLIPETCEEIIPAPGFAVIATMNPSHDYAGTKGLNPALYSRFGAVLRFETPIGSRLVEALEIHADGSDPAHVMELARLFESMQDLRKRELILTRITLRECIAALGMVKSGLSLEKAISYAIASKLEAHEIEEARKNGISLESLGLSVPRCKTVKDILAALSESESLTRENRKLKKELSAFSHLDTIVRSFSEAAKESASESESLESAVR